MVDEYFSNSYLIYVIVIDFTAECVSVCSVANVLPSVTHSVHPVTQAHQTGVGVKICLLGFSRLPDFQHQQLSARLHFLKL